MKPGTLFDVLTLAEQSFVAGLCLRFRLTHQELRKLVEDVRDLSMWREAEAAEIWKELEEEIRPRDDRRLWKELLLKAFNGRIGAIRHAAKSYPALPPASPSRPALRVTAESSDKNIVGCCPVYSEKTLCCGLRTIDAVQNCGFGCSYCSIQTFYGDDIVIDARLGEKLRALKLDPGTFHHFGTGQSSDSLLWGNRFGLLDELCAFAAANPDILLELKTKADNIDYFVERRGAIPDNVVCSWSLNTDTIIANEEHYTASLQRRLNAARRAADSGVRVAFHFHPIVFYSGWEKEYGRVANELTESFAPEEVSFVSMGSVTFIKSALLSLRRRGLSTKIHQMEMVQDPHGKMTYPDDLKLDMFRSVYHGLRGWHGKVFMYLCMEKPEIWERLWGRRYRSNEEFLNDFGQAVRPRRTKATSAVETVKAASD